MTFGALKARDSSAEEAGARIRRTWALVRVAKKWRRTSLAPAFLFVYLPSRRMHDMSKVHVEIDV